MDAVEQRLRALAAYCASYPQVGLEDSVVSEHLAACLREVRAVTNLSQQKCQDVQAFLQSATLPGPVKSGLKEALMEQLARSEAGRLDSARKCLQNFVTVPWYLVPSLWAALLSEGNTVATKHSLLLQFLARLGLKNPSEATHGMVTVLTHLTSQVVLRDAQQAFAIYVRQKEVSQAFFRRLLPEVERPYYRELPADPMQLERRLFDQVYSEEQPARPLPLAYSELLALHAAVPLRKSNAQLPRSSSVQGTGNLWQALLGSAQISNPEAALVLQRALSALSASSSVQLPGFRLLGSAASGAVAEGQGNSSAPELPGFQLALPQSTSCLSLPAAAPAAAAAAEGVQHQSQQQQLQQQQSAQQGQLQQQTTAQVPAQHEQLQQRTTAQVQVSTALAPSTEAAPPETTHSAPTHGVLDFAACVDRLQGKGTTPVPTPARSTSNRRLAGKQSPSTEKFLAHKNTKPHKATVAKSQKPKVNVKKTPVQKACKTPAAVKGKDKKVLARRAAKQKKQLAAGVSAALLKLYSHGCCKCRYQVSGCTDSCYTYRGQL